MDDKYEALDRGFTRLAEKMFTRTEGGTGGLRIIQTQRRVVRPPIKMQQCEACDVMVHEQRSRDGEVITKCPCCHVGTLAAWVRPS